MKLRHAATGTNLWNHAGSLCPQKQLFEIYIWNFYPTVYPFLWKTNFYSWLLSSVWKNKSNFYKLSLKHHRRKFIEVGLHKPTVFWPTRFFCKKKTLGSKKKINAAPWAVPGAAVAPPHAAGGPALPWQSFAFQTPGNKKNHPNQWWFMWKKNKPSVVFLLWKWRKDPGFCMK